MRAHTHTHRHTHTHTLLVRIAQLICVFLLSLTATFAIQDISITVLSNGLTVQCVFAEGTTQDVCTVILVFNEVEKERGRFSGKMTFYELASGSYTVLVFDTEPEIELPCIKRRVEVPGVREVTPSPSYGEIGTLLQS